MHEHDNREPYVRGGTQNTQGHEQAASYLSKLFHSTHLLFFKGATDTTTTHLKQYACMS